MRGVVKVHGKNFHGRRAAGLGRALAVLMLLPSAFLLPTPHARGQEVVDRMVAVVNGAELITYSDLLWQLALQPGVPLDSPRREDLRRVLELLIDQRLVLQEADKLPHVHATEEEMKRAEVELIKRFPSLEEFQRRLERTGLTPAQLRAIIHERLDMEKYLNFRFRSFTVVTPQEVETYYREVYVPRRRRQSPGAIVPELKAVYDELQAELIERKVESDTDNFLEEARAAAQVTVLDESLGDGVQGGAGGLGTGAGGARPSGRAPSAGNTSPPAPGP